MRFDQKKRINELTKKKRMMKFTATTCICDFAINKHGHRSIQNYVNIRFKGHAHVYKERHYLFILFFWQEGKSKDIIIRVYKVEKLIQKGGRGDIIATTTKRHAREIKNVYN